MYQHGDILNRAIHKIRTNLQVDNDGKYLPDTGRPVPTKPPRPWWRPTRTSAEIETTAYALLAIKHVSFDSMLLLRWLTHQRNAYGGWRSTQDTVVSLRAISAFGVRLGYSSQSKYQLVELI